MTSEKMQIAIGQILRVGVFISFILVSIGGAQYLWKNGNAPMSFAMFSTLPAHFVTVPTIFLHAFDFSALGLIQLGLLTLVLLQLARVIFTTAMFVVLRESLFIIICLFILSVLIYSLFWYHPNF